MRSLILASLLASSAALAAELPDTRAARAEFMRASTCPATGKAGSCPGHQVDWRVPLCAGGKAEAANMQWLSFEQVREKARKDAAVCRTHERRRGASERDR